MSIYWKNRINPVYLTYSLLHTYYVKLIIIHVFTYNMYFKIFVKTFSIVKFLPHTVMLKLLFCACDDTVTTESNILVLDS